MTALRDRTEILRRLKAGEPLHHDGDGWYFDGRSGERITPVDGRVVRGLCSSGEAVEIDRQGFDLKTLAHGGIRP